jgi:hypothetical protein
MDVETLKESRIKILEVIIVDKFVGFEKDETTISFILE